MATLVSPGVSVTITDESFFIPASASTVPLFFVATEDEKYQIDGVTPAAGTYENNVIRTVTSLRQSLELYGIPSFLEDSSGNQFHGDARNEYGIFAVNQFLGIGNRAFVLRANVNLNDDITDIRTMWDRKVQDAAFLVENLTNSFLNEYNITNGFIPGDAGYRDTVSNTEFYSLADEAAIELFAAFSFMNAHDNFFDDVTLAPLDVFANGYDQIATGTYLGLAGLMADWILNNLGSVVATEFTAAETSGVFVAASDDFKYTKEFKNTTSLGANDAARRVAITTALQATININTEIRSENFEYNLILCPGYPEVSDEMLALVADIEDEALVIGDTPMSMTPTEVVAWAGTTGRQTSTNIAYYYPHSLASNLDGKNVMVASSGTALRTIAYSDEVSELWLAPAGTRRGLVTGVTDVGYTSGQLGGPTSFVSAHLNLGQRDDLYKYFTNINPITFFPSRGILVWGQKTAAPDASALDRINVSRLVKYIKRQLRKNTMAFVFEPNDQLTRDNLKATVDGFLGDLIVKRGLYDYATICDESNNTPDRIDRNEMYLDIALKPVKAAEFIYIPIRVVSTGAEI